MKTYLTLFLLSSIFYNVATAQIPVHQEPLHRPVFENELARILDVRAQVGDTSLMHVHANNYVYVALHGGRLWLAEDVNSRAVNMSDGFISGYFENPDKPLVHKFANISDKAVRLIAVENLGEQDATGPTLHELAENEVISNSSFKVSKITILPEAHLELPLRHPAVIVNLNAATIKITKRQNSVNLVDWEWLDPGASYAFSNSSADSASLVVIEVK